MDGISTDLVSSLLNKALSIAQMLGDDDLEIWARLETNGYAKENTALTEDVVVPKYRTVIGQYSDVYGRPLVKIPAWHSYTKTD